jgi:hypothetical protein
MLLAIKGRVLEEGGGGGGGGEEEEETNNFAVETLW